MRQIRGLGLERAPASTAHDRSTRSAPRSRTRRCRDRASDADHRPHGDGQGRRRPADGDDRIENKVSTHGQPLSAAGADIAATVKHLGGDPENPFAVFEDVEGDSTPRAAKSCVHGSSAPEGRRGRVALRPTRSWPRKLDMFLVRRAAGHRLQVDRDEAPMSATRAASADGAGRTGRAGART